MRFSLGADPISRLERRLARLGVRLGAAEHASLRIPEAEATSIRPELHRLDDELWRIDLRVVSRGSDEALLSDELDAVDAQLAEVERRIERAMSVDRHPARGRAHHARTTVVPLRARSEAVVAEVA